MLWDKVSALPPGKGEMMGTSSHSPDSHSKEEFQTRIQGSSSPTKIILLKERMALQVKVSDLLIFSEDRLGPFR